MTSVTNSHKYLARAWRRRRPGGATGAPTKSIASERGARRVDSIRARFEPNSSPIQARFEYGRAEDGRERSDRNCGELDNTAQQTGNQMIASAGAATAARPMPTLGRLPTMETLIMLRVSSLVV